MHREIKIKITAGFSPETVQSRRYWSEIFKILELTSRQLVGFVTFDNWDGSRSAQITKKGICFYSKDP